MLIEKYAGAFPTWMSPVQVKLLPISDKYNEYANKVSASLKNLGIRVETDYRAEKIGYKIREARLERSPYILIVGDKEAASNTVSVRSRKGDVGSMSLDDFESKILKEIASKSIEQLM